MIECIVFETWVGQSLASCDLKRHDFSDVIGCVIDILGDKNDKKHKGNRMYCGLADLNDPTQNHCLTNALGECAKAKRSVRGRSVFYIPEINWML